MPMLSNIHKVHTAEGEGKTVQKIYIFYRN